MTIRCALMQMFQFHRISQFRRAFDIQICHAQCEYFNQIVYMHIRGFQIQIFQIFQLNLDFLEFLGSQRFPQENLFCVFCFIRSRLLEFTLAFYNQWIVSLYAASGGANLGSVLHRERRLSSSFQSRCSCCLFFCSSSFCFFFRC